jgi:capsular exopolysaccharide synthesis family protein
LSKYYELLQRTSVKGGGRPGVLPAPLRVPRTYEMRPVPDAHVLSREELVKLVQTVFLLPGDNSPRVVVFTGAESAAGCSSICAGAAEALAANVDEPVCLVDSNLRYPSLHLCLGVENNKGLGEALASSEPIQDYVRKLPGDSMCLLSAGHVSSPLAWTINSSRMGARINELRQIYRFILMDSPSVNVYSDAICLGQSADGVVLVVSANSTRKEAGRRAKESLEMAGARLLGAVLNKRTYPIPQPIYDRL